MTPCKNCRFFVKPQWRINWENDHPEDEKRSECRHHSPVVIDRDSIEPDYPMPCDDDPGCGDGEPKDGLLEVPALNRVKVLEMAIRSHKRNTAAGTTSIDRLLYEVLDAD